jgi:inner membrane protein
MEQQEQQHTQKEFAEMASGAFSALRKDSLLTEIRNSHLLKIMLIGFLILLFQIPIAMINETIDERQNRSDAAEWEVASKWGNSQQIVGPFITVPFERTVLRSNRSSSDTNQTETVIQYANFLPEDLHIHAKVDNMLRHRGIFDIPVYRMDLVMDGEFKMPDFSELEEQASRILWDQAKLNLLISDTRAITNKAFLTWNKEEIIFESGGGLFSDTNRGIQADLKNKLESGTFAFSFQIDIQGSSSVFFAPAGRNTEARLESNWGDPSFQGNWLPAERQIAPDKTKAVWKIPAIGRNFPQTWINKANTPPAEQMDTFGVDFILPVDLYRMTERSIKYQFLFLTLTFASLWLFEVLTKSRLHAIQYFLVGAGMCLFYLLELSLAEHIGFLWAYLIAAASIVLLISFYCVSILKTPTRALTVGSFITLLYGYLYILLINQDYALLAGSIGLFFVLGGIMYLTRKINWYNIQSNHQTGDQAAKGFGKDRQKRQGASFRSPHEGRHHIPAGGTGTIRAIVLSTRPFPFDTDRMILRPLFPDTPVFPTDFPSCNSFAAQPPASLHKAPWMNTLQRRYKQMKQLLSP